jgi:alpha/beta superfamily hydrolase
VAYPFSVYSSDALKPFPGAIYFVGGDRDEIGPVNTLLEFYKNLTTIDKHIKIILTDHFYGGKEREIADFIKEQVSLPAGPSLQGSR